MQRSMVWFLFTVGPLSLLLLFYFQFPHGAAQTRPPPPPPQEKKCPEPPPVKEAERIWTFDENVVLNKVLGVPVDRSELKKTLELYADTAKTFTRLRIDGQIVHSAASTSTPSDYMSTSLVAAFRSVLKNGYCDENDVIIDATGASSAGIFGLYTASKGCKTIFFQPDHKLASQIYASLKKTEISDVAVVIPRDIDEEIIHFFIKDSYNVRLLFVDADSSFKGDSLKIIERSRSVPHSIVLYRPYQTNTDASRYFGASLIYKFSDATGTSLTPQQAQSKLSTPGSELMIQAQFLGTTLDLCYDPKYNKVVGGVLINQNLNLPAMKQQLTFNWEQELTNLVKVQFKQDPTVTYSLWNTEMIQWVTTYFGELEVGDVFHQVLKNGCKDNEVVLDIGANTGFYGMYAASKGCKTIFFDPQPTCAKYLQTELFANGFYDHALVVPRPVGNGSNKMTVSYETGCGGRFPMSEIEKGNAGGVYQESMDVETVSIDKIINAGYNIKIAKIDTEGAESFVLPSLRELIASNRVENIVVEVTPIFYPKMNLDRAAVAEVFRDIATAGNYVGKVLNGAGGIFLNSPEAFRVFAGETQFTQLDVWMHRNQTKSK